MSWFEKRIRRYEHRRWTTDDNRRVRPFDWGLEHIGEAATASIYPRSSLGSWVGPHLARSEEWFARTAGRRLRLACSRKMAGAARRPGLTFTSAVGSPWPENNRVHARLFAVSKSGPAVVVLPQWNAKWDVQVKICLWLNRWELRHCAFPCLTTIGA